MATKKTTPSMLLFGSIDNIKETLDAGVPINYKSKFGGKTALMERASSNDIEELKYLLEHGANPRLRDNRGYTALHYAIESEKASPEIVRLLVKAWPEGLTRQSLFEKTPVNMIIRNTSRTPLMEAKLKILQNSKIPILDEFKSYMKGRLYDPNTQSGQHLIAASKASFEHEQQQQTPSSSTTTTTITTTQGGKRNKQTKKRQNRRKHRKTTSKK